jgi:prepilin signal peptidase PulO-like enzyme (type II secretory pathway)
MEQLFIARNLIFIIILSVLFYTDLKNYLLPNKIIFPAIILALLLNIVLGINWLILFLGGLIGLVFFLVQYLLTKGKMLGFGDVNLGFLAGLLLGWPNILVALVIAYILGGITGLYLLIFKNKKFNDKLPLGSFLCLATIVGLLWGQEIINIILNI